MLKVAWSECYAHPLPEGHRFPMEKYELLPMQLLHEGTLTKDDFFEPEMVSEEAILEIHDADYWQKLKSLSLTKREERKTGFPLSEALIQRERTIMQGTVDCAHFALEHGASLNIAGGTHHAFTNRGEGFCLLNDIALGAKSLLNQFPNWKILVVDLDVHQGNGTAEIFKNEERVFTFSMHGEHNYPLQKEQSNLDIGLPDGTKDDDYLKVLTSHYHQLITDFKPDFIFFQTGVDIINTDKLGRMAISIEGCKKRDEIVLSTAERHQIPVCMSMGGGYSPDIKHIVEAHANTYRITKDIFF